eukprot:TRINITY_DN7372_c0_g2_i1.p1 TRINITY_DN7372_c0_g2~~TRINITY_DN7372_c0_g2_i1.p1  ORF type:complete len:654 (-),score=121.17 TRINITY_DN7372_c0_g2_i1:629-2590(-)
MRRHSHSQFREGWVVAGMEVVVEKLNVSVSVSGLAEPKRLLQDLTFRVDPGDVVALMGPSGAGKTTLLNCLVGRGNVGTVDGSLSYNGLHLGQVRSDVGYVTQDDIMYESLTPRENLSFAAALLQRSASLAERRAAVEDVLHKLNLMKCADTLVGTPGLVKGISGGERKRTNVALSLLAQPTLLLLDEPTSGLDSKMAEELMADVGKVAQQGCTVIATIHQPSEAVFQRFAKILLLSAGQIAHYGPVPGLRGTLQDLGFETPEGKPLPEVLLEILDEGASHEEMQQHRLAQLKAMSTSDSDVPANAAAAPVVASRHGFFGQLRILIQREALAVRRNKTLTVVRAVQSVAATVLVGWIFAQLPRNVSGVQSRLFAGFLLIFGQFMFALLGVVNAFPAERAVFLREAQDRLYHPAAFYLSKVMLDTVMQSLFPLIVVAIGYGMIGLNMEAFERVLLFYIILSIVSNCGSAIGFAVSAAVSSVSTALSIAPGLVMPQLLLAGIFIKVEDMPQPFNALSHLMVARYAVQAFATNEFTCDTNAECTDAWRFSSGHKCDDSPCHYCCSDHDVKSSAGVCPVLTCDDALKFLGFDEPWPQGETNSQTIAYNIIALLCALVFFRLQGLNVLMMSYRHATGSSCMCLKSWWKRSSEVCKEKE